MSTRYRHGLIASLGVSLVSLSVSAQNGPEYRCVQGDLQRRVVIFYETGVAVPCEVQYFKDTEAPGQREVLWRALNQSGYCESRAETFVEQLEGWGWSCSAGVAAGGETESAEEPEPVDDTDNLAPAAPGAGG